MSFLSRAVRRDASHAEVVGALRAHGCSVQELSVKGVPDLLVGLHQRTYLVEVKAPKGPRGGQNHRKLLPTQEVWHRSWKGDPPYILRSAWEAVEWVKQRLEDERGAA